MSTLCCTVCFGLVKGIVLSKMKIYSPSGHPKCRWVFLYYSSKLIWRNLALHHLLTSGSSEVNGCRQNSQDVNWWTGVVWITCELLRVQTADKTSHSDGTHSLKGIYWCASSVVLNFSKFVPMKKQSHHGWLEGEYNFSKLKFLGELFL